eukprot:Plantae.Rhodophyta-Rhodochaete_pulchella.ctg7647.p1 GENE.Plantae.Rhodophyta-Rhodochaete_pulchella.ctg7647~~Plantae.Rhodophyta-Rhodochaete_pulchella.ctg7647.p1  ORF type:complete len:592 (-),score=84.87 Plantae.Rhodophyta-Rhodochaete_pulchella.ctg7647:327-1844(-)
MTMEDFLRFARVDLFEEKERKRLSALLLALISSNRKRLPLSTDSSTSSVDEGALFDFWEFLRFDIALNDPDAACDFAFRLTDRDNSGVVDLEELEALLTDYAGVEPGSVLVLDSGALQRIFGRHGAKRLTYKEFRQVYHEILPAQFRRDVQVLSEHLLHNMDTPIAGSFVAESVGSLEDGPALGRLEQHANTPSQRRSTVENLAAIFISTAVSTTIVAPLKRLKILMQTEALTLRKDQNRKFYGIIQGLREMYRLDRSMGAFFRGNLPNVLRTGPASCIQIAFVEMLRSSMYADRFSVAPALGSYEPVVVGGVAGLVAATITYPLDLLHARMSIFRNGNEISSSLLRTASLTVRENGVNSLYRGLSPTLFGVFPYVGLSFAVHETVRPILPKKNDGSGSPTALGFVLCGIVASLSAQTAVYPFDTIRRRMQVESFVSMQGNARSTVLQTIAGIIREEGTRGLYRGWFPSVLKIVPATIAGFTVYESTKGLIQQRKTSSSVPMSAT